MGLKQLHDGSPSIQLNSMGCLTKNTHVGSNPTKLFQEDGLTEPTDALGLKHVGSGPRCAILIYHHIVFDVVENSRSPDGPGILKEHQRSRATGQRLTPIGKNAAQAGQASRKEVANERWRYGCPTHGKRPDLAGIAR